MRLDELRSKETLRVGGSAPDSDYQPLPNSMAS